jgi:hypothetical protein
MKIYNRPNQSGGGAAIQMSPSFIRIEVQGCAHMLRLAVVCLMFAAAAPASAIVFGVNNGSDSEDLIPGDGKCDTDGAGTCTLRAAIQETNARATGEDEIEIEVPEAGLATPLPDITIPVVISGLGSASTTITTTTEFLEFRIFNVTVPKPGWVYLNDMTITRGGARDGWVTCAVGGVNNSGTGTVNITKCVITGNVGGVSNSSGSMNITDSAIDGNQTGYIGGGVCMDGGTVTILDSSVSGNQCFVGSGGTVVSEGGGIFCRAGLLIISNTVISGNWCLVSQSSSFPKGGGIFCDKGIVNLSNSTIESNRLFDLDPKGVSPSEGGGLINLNGWVSILNCLFRFNYALIGAGLSNDFGTVTLTNSTMSRNGGIDSTQVGGAVLNEAGLVNLSNSTFSGNVSADGNGIVNIASSVVKNSLFDDRVSGGFISKGFNLVRIVDGSTGFTASTDQTGTVASPLDPMLDPAGLQDNGGNSLTIALLPGSPARDKASSQGIDIGLTTDQRGFGFPRTIDDLAIPNAAGGDGTDIGAFEAGIPSPTPKPTPTPKNH